MIDIYCNCYMGKSPKEHQFNQRNIMCGAHSYPEDIKIQLLSEGYILDDSGDNISNVNQWFGELTGLYWVWKNTAHEFKATNQYRHFWDADQKILEKDTIYVVEPIKVSDAVRDTHVEVKNIYHHYSYLHSEVFLQMLYGLCESRQLPINSRMIDKLKTQDQLYPFNMFIAESKIFDKLCEILFSILIQYHDCYYFLFPAAVKQFNQKRFIDFLSERVLHMIYSDINYYFDRVKIVPLKVKTYPHES